jgi:tetratricopeptide (TPR) repeat protein
MKHTVFPLAALFFFAASFCFAQQKPDALKEYLAGNLQRAVEICQDEIKANPKNLESHVVICWSYLRLRRYNEARNYAQAGLGISRYDPRIIEALAEAHYYQGNNAESLRYFQEYITLLPQGSRIDASYYFLGELYIRMARYRHADIALTTAVYYQPKNALWWTRLAWARENAGEASQAIQAYEKALAIDPNLGDAKTGLERVRAKNRQ